MALKSLKLTKSDKAEEKAEVDGDSIPDYPWGTSICLDDDALEKLGIDDMPAAGQKVLIQAEGYVCGTREHVRDGEMHKGLDVQLTDMSLDKIGKSISSRMYKDSE